MGLEAGVYEGVFHRLGIEHRERAVRLLQREQLGRGVVRALLAEVGVLGAAHRRRHPYPALLVDHGVVVVDLAVPDLLVAPIGGGAQRFGHGGMAGA